MVYSTYSDKNSSDFQCFFLEQLPKRWTRLMIGISGCRFGEYSGPVDNVSVAHIDMVTILYCFRSEEKYRHVGNII